MLLHDLNDDLICEIADVLPPDEAIAFAQCSKRFHALSSPRLKRHKEYQRKYSRLRITRTAEDNPTSWAAVSALRALYQISKDPERASYVRRLEYRETDPDDMLWCNVEDDDGGDLAGFLEEELDCLFDCEFLDDEEKENWYNTIMLAFWGDEAEEDHCCATGHCLVLLLSLLPNLEFLELSDTLPCLGALEDLVEYIEQNRAKSDVPLSKLRTLYVDSTPTLGLIARFLNIPSVRQLYVSNVMEQLGAWSMAILEQCETTSLRVIGLADSALSPPVLKSLVQKSPHLQSLTLAWDEDTAFPCGCTVEMSNELQLLDHAIGSKDVLEELFAGKGFSMRYIEDEEEMYGLRIFEINIDRKL